MMPKKSSLQYRALRRLLGEVGLTKVWEYFSAYYLWHAFPLNGKSRRLFQIVGVPRSGTTLLCSVLASHSRVICLSEPYHQWKYDGFVYTKEISDLIGCDVWRKHPTLLIKKLISMSNNKLIGFKEIYYSQSHGHYSNHFFFKRNYSKSILTIAIVRDVREVWKSLILRHPGKRGSVPFRFTEAWNDLVQWILENEVFYIKYEELISNPVEVLKRVCDYLKIEFEDSMLLLKKREARGDAKALQGGIIENKLSEYTKYLNQNEVDYIEKECGELMQIMGYL